MAQFEEDAVADDVTEGDETGDNGEDTTTSDRLKAVEQNQALSALLGDAEVQEVIRLKREGKKVSVSEGVKAAEKPDADAEVYDDDDPQAEILKRIEGIFDRKLGPLSERISSIEGLADDVQKKDINVQIQTVRDRHSDFDDYREKMLSMSEKSPTLKVEELYLLAKHNAGKLKLDEPSTFSEKPTSQPRARIGMKKSSAGQRGRQGFTRILSSALDKLEIDMG